MFFFPNAMSCRGLILIICLVNYVRESQFETVNEESKLGDNVTSTNNSSKRPYERQHGRVMDSSELDSYNHTFGDDYAPFAPVEGDEDALNVTEYNNMQTDTWLNLESVMDLYTQREYDNISAVQALSAAYRYTLRQQKKLKTLPAYYKKGFYAIEGLDKQKRAMLANRLALHTHGQVVPNPPHTFDVVIKHLPENNTLLVNGYYVLCTYITALHVRYATQRAPAIVPGYWLGRAALTIARSFVNKPPPFESKFWIWPKDLVKPDIVFYITDRYSLHQFSDHKLVQRYLHVFDNWVEPKCVPLVNTQSIDAMIEEIEPYLQQRQ